MERFEWNALRIGHRVVVHDPASADMVLMPGVVLMVDAHVGRKGVNGVGIRVSDTDGTTRVLWPQYPAVHLHPLDSSEPCWRCEEIAARDDRSRALVLAHGL